MRALIQGLLLLLLVLEAAAGTYSLQIGNVTWTGGPAGYDCFSSTAYPNTVNFTITKLDPGRQDYAITAGPSTVTGDYNRKLASGANRLNYQLYKTTSMIYVLKAPPVALSTEVISGSEVGGSGAVIPLSFVLYIPPGQLVPPGTYTDQITVSIYKSFNDPGPPQDYRQITITATVAPGAALALVSSGSGFSTTTSQNLNFGELQKDKSLGCDLLIKKNTGCNITFSSLRGGVLKAIPTPTTDSVPYTCKVSGNPISLSTPALITLPSGVSPPPDGNRLPVRITIGDLGNAAAGDYQDEITITVVTQ